MARKPRQAVTLLGTGIRIPPESLLKPSGASKRARTPKDTTRSTRAVQDPSRAGTSSPTTSYAAVLSGLSEAAFQALVVSHLKSRRYRVVIIPDMRRTEAGWPDVVAIRAGVPVLLAWELKRERMKPTRIQTETLAILSQIPGVDARVVRPALWPRVRDALESRDLLAALSEVDRCL